MKIAVFPETCAIAGRPVMNAFIKSLQGEDYSICKNSERPNADLVVIWSVLLNMYGRKPIYEYYKKNGTNILVLEVGGIQRNKSWRVGLNGINRNAQYGNTNADDKRLEKLNLQLQPWRKGEDIIICTQNENSAAWPNITVYEWVDQMLHWIRNTSNRKVWLRPHPRHKVNLDSLCNKYSNVQICYPVSTGNADEVDFSKFLSNAHAVINYNSNPAIESVLAGVPVFVDTSSLCWPVGNPIGSDIENPKTPDRTGWLNEISYCEWFVDEIEKGEPWQRIRSIIK